MKQKGREHMKFKKQMAALAVAVMLMQGLPVYVFQPVRIVASEQMTTIADGLYQDNTFTAIKTTVTQSQIDQLMNQAENISEMTLKTVTMVRLTDAMNQLQEMRFTGYGNRHFATFAYYSESGIAQYRTNAITPHSGISALYLSIEVKDENQQTVFKREIKGTDALSAETIDIVMKEGYSLDIYKCEPGRFETNHNDVLKHDSVNPFQYKVMNGKLARLHEGNRTFTLSQDGQAYAYVKVDYNANKLYVEHLEGLMLNHNASFVLAGYQDEIVHESKFTKGTVSEKASYSLNFYPNQKLLFHGGASISVRNDDGVLDDFNFQDGSQIALNRNGIYFESTSFSQDVYSSVFHKMIPNEALERIQLNDTTNAGFLNWFCNDAQALKYYLEAGNASDIKLGTMDHFGYHNYPFSLENEVKALQILADIYAVDKACTSGIKLKMAIAVSKEFASGVTAWMGGSMIDPVARYQLYAQSYDEGIFFDDFGALSSADLRNVVVCQITNDDIIWLRNYIETQKPEMLTRNKIVSGHSLLVYREKNPETGESIHGPNFYGPNPTIQEVIKYGGVCGTMSKFSVVLAQAYGIPAQAVGQPGHCAYQYLNPKGDYNLGYDVFGWEQCGNWNTTFPYLKLNAELNKNRSRFEESEYYRLQAVASNVTRDKIAYIAKAVEIEPLNYLAWEEYLTYSVSGSMEYYMMCQKIEKALVDYPVIVENLTGKQVKEDILNIFNEEGHLSDTVTVDQLNRLQSKLDGLIDGAYKTTYQNMIDTAKASLKQFKLTGISYRNVVDIIVFEDGSNRVRIETAAGQPHYNFNEPYIVVDIYDELGNIVYHRSISGVESLEASSTMLNLNDGAKMTFKLRETFRINTPDDANLKVLKNNLYSYVKVNGTFVLE